MKKKAKSAKSPRKGGKKITAAKVKATILDYILMLLGASV